MRVPANEKLLLALAAVFLIISRLLLLLLPFTAIRHLLQRTSPPTVRLGADPGSPSRINWAVEAAGSALPGMRCLPRALAAVVLLGLYGYPAQLRVGVAKSADGRLEAHSWVECQGRVVIGGFDHLDRYVPLSM